MSCTVAVCILAHEDKEMIQDFLTHCADYYIENGMDLYFYDTSHDDSVKTIISAWQDHKHVFYVRQPYGTTLDEKELFILQKNGLVKDYDFLCIHADYVQYQRSDIINIMGRINADYDFIEYYHFGETHEFTDPNEFLLNGFGMGHRGSCMVNIHTMLENVDWNKYELFFRKKSEFLHDGFVNFYLRRFLDLRSFHALFIRIDIWRSSIYKKSSFWSDNFFDLLLDGTYSLYELLPDAYSQKWNAFKRNSWEFGLDYIENYYSFRKKGIYTMNVFLRYWSKWGKVTVIPRIQLFFVAIMPRMVIEAKGKIKLKKTVAALKKFCFKHKRVSIFGARRCGDIIGNYLEQNRIQYDFYSCTKRNAQKTQFRNHAVKALTEIEGDFSDIGFIVAMGYGAVDVALPALLKHTSEEHIFFDPEFINSISNDNSLFSWLGGYIYEKYKKTGRMS